MVLANKVSSTAWLHENVNSRASWLHALKGAKVDALVTLDSSVSCGGTLGKSRGVEHHDVVVPEFVRFQVFQCVGLDGCVRLDRQLIQSHVVLTDVEGAL